MISTALVLVPLLLVVCVIAVIVRTSRRAPAPDTADAGPLDPDLDEVFARPETGGEARRRQAERLLRAATPHIHRVLHETAANPVLIVASSPRVGDEILVVTTDQTLVVGGRGMQVADHRPATSTRVLVHRDRTEGTVEITSATRVLMFLAETAPQAKRIARAIDVWATHPSLRHDPRVRITPHRVTIPEEFYADTLRAAGYPVTPNNLRSLHERFGMQVIHKARAFIDGRDPAAGERFTARYGRPPDSDLPGWTAGVLSGWIDHEPTIADMATAVLCQIRTYLLASPYLGDPNRPLSMWKSDRYADGGAGRLRPESGSGRPGVPA